MNGRKPLASGDIRKSIRPDSNSSRLIFILLLFVIIDDFDVPCFILTPSKTYPPLIVDADAVLTAAVGWPAESGDRLDPSRNRSPEAWLWPGAE